MMNIEFLQIEPTTRCNFKCIFCYGRNIELVDMNFDVYKTIIDSFPGLKYVHLQGDGEPFLHPRIFDMIEYANKKGIRIFTISNGSLFTKENVEKILENTVDIIAISIESPIHEEFKRIRGGNLEKIKQGISLLIEERNKRGLKLPQVAFASTVMKGTKDNVEGIFDLYRELGMDGGIGFQRLQELSAYSQHYSTDLAEEILSEEEFTQFVNSISHLYETIKTEESVLKGIQMSHNNMMYVNAHGYACGCHNIKNYLQHGFGRFGYDSVEEILSKNNIDMLLSQGVMPPGCEECAVAKVIVQSAKG